MDLRLTPAERHCDDVGAATPEEVFAGAGQGGTVEFTRYVWNLYAASDCGRAATAKPAEVFAGSSDGEVDALLRFRYPLFRDVPDGDVIPIEDGFAENDVRDDLRTGFSDRVVNDAETAKLLFTELVDEGLKLSFEEAGEALCYFLGGEEFEHEVFGNIEALSLGLYNLYPEYFVPFLFRTRFDQFSAICRSFNIPIPPPPGKTQRRDRAFYYLALNEALQGFRRRHQLAPPELIASRRRRARTYAPGVTPEPVSGGE